MASSTATSRATPATQATAAQAQAGYKIGNIFSEYDLSAFIKNPDKQDNKYKEMLDVLNLTDKRWMHHDQEFHILKYDRSKIQVTDVKTSGLFRSVVHANGEILAFAPPKSLNEAEFMSQYPPTECIAEEIVEGTMINLFYSRSTQTWEIATKSTFGAKCVFFKNGEFKEEDTFRALFFEVCQRLGFDYTSLPKENCYSFVFQHPRNRIVVPIIDMKLYLIAAYTINNTTFEITKIANDNLPTILQRPKTYQFTSYDDIEALITYMNDDFKETGIMIHHPLTGARMKIRNPHNEFVRRLRGNQPKLQYRYLELRQEGKVAPYLRYFSSAQAEFKVFQAQLHTFTEELHRLYIACYIKKTKPLMDYPAKFRTHMFQLHQIYKKRAEGPSKIITKIDVIGYVNTLPPALLMADLNADFHVSSNANTNDITAIDE